MLVQIFNQENGLKEWCMLDFQGEIVGKEVGQSLGTLKFDENFAELEIGSYVLEGEIVKLKKPYLIIDENENNQIQIESENESKIIFDENGESLKSFKMIGLVTKKIHFKTRPRPITNSN